LDASCLRQLRFAALVFVLSPILLREKLAPYAFIKNLGPQFMCRECYGRWLRARAL
jgi:hypothetical protein